ncbi:non-ribosomal peptide synthetase [Streptomyces sp. NPDC001118]
MLSSASSARYLHQLFEAQVDAAPENVAIAFEGDELSYRQVEEEANRIANALIQFGVTPDTPVGICVDRSPRLISGLLGILKAGGAYVPIDSELPTQRINQIMIQAQARLCLTEAQHASLFDEAVTTYCIDTDQPEILSAPTTRPRVLLSPHNLISVYFTSGSTGTPKGVGSTQLGWLNRMEVMQATHGIKPGETVLHKTTLSFDDAALEIFWPLAYGGTVAPLPPRLHRDPRAVLEAAARHRTVLLQVVPSMLTAMLDLAAGECPPLPALRSVVSSGEALLPAIVDRFYASMPGTLHNTWGATEASIDSTSHTCEPADACAEGSVCIGRPFPPHTVYVLDADLEPVGPGESGDLYVGGSGLARGYLGDPVKTADSFIPDPFRPGERMYRTGDRGYLDVGGNLHYLGRADHQVKIRGMRVEFGEIESVIARHPAVKEAVVDVRKAGNGLTRLVAYATLMNPEERMTVAELRRHLTEFLPDYMQPSSIAFMERFPVNANGKVDRSQLATLDLSHTLIDEEHTSPEGPVEMALADIWADLFDLESPSTTQNFFLLGGQSLLAVTLVSRIRQRFGVNLKPQEVYDLPTISLLAAHVTQLLEAKVQTMSDAELEALLGGLS